MWSNFIITSWQICSTLCPSLHPRYHLITPAPWLTPIACLLVCPGVVLREGPPSRCVSHSAGQQPDSVSLPLPRWPLRTPATFQKRLPHTHAPLCHLMASSLTSPREQRPSERGPFVPVLPNLQSPSVCPSCLT